ncbi:early nodulin-93-like [Hordeum vulgare subsp. vulgare]|uniref:Early nodulin-93-like n=1 Tax=Hordeum vulgare subsp. vulgare TaxID=112509 RepID=A0A8I6YC61_HORVV|nr:early nodulin-93-like [Hordeum vulgare subsp. vulgare]
MAPRVTNRLVQSEEATGETSRRQGGAMAARNFLLRSPKEEESSAAIREAVLLGGKNAAIAGTVVAVPTFVACRVLPWAKHNLNYTAQALIISTACVAGFFITADKTILRNARQNTIGRIDEST